LKKIDYKENLTTNQLPALQDHLEYEKEIPRKCELENANLFPETIEGPTTELLIYLSIKFKQPTSQAHKALQWWNFCEVCLFFYYCFPFNFILTSIAIDS
jgi:hypothetical protein